MFISTKAVGKFEREDITHLYKYKDSKFLPHISYLDRLLKHDVFPDTAEEREVVLKALRQCENLFSRYYLNEALEDVRFDFQLRDDIVIGQPFR